MKPIPHWFKAALGMRIGFAKFVMLDFVVVNEMDEATFECMKTTHARMNVAVSALEEFSTRDYAYDRGGEQISDAYLQEFRYAIWRRGS